MDEDYMRRTAGGACAKVDDEQMDTSGASAAPDPMGMDTSEPHGSSSSVPNRLFHPDAFQHNCSLTIEKHPPKCNGCHDLDCLIHAMAQGVVVASVDKLPGDGLPQGVYQIQMSCRKDQPTPNLQLKKSKRKPKKCQRHKVEPNACQSLILRGSEEPTNDQRNQLQEPMNDTPTTPACTGFSTFEYSPYTRGNQGNAGPYVKCPLPEPLLPEQRNEGARQEHGVIKFKLKTQLKTVYNPAIWTREKLEQKCRDAFKNAIEGTLGGKCDEKLERWIGPFVDDYDNKKYWFEGYYKVIKEGNPQTPRKQISSFYFIHPDTLKRRGISTN